MGEGGREGGREGGWGNLKNDIILMIINYTPRSVVGASGVICSTDDYFINLNGE